MPIRKSAHGSLELLQICFCKVRSGPSLKFNQITKGVYPGILIAQTTKYFTYDTGDSSNRRFVYLVLFLSVICILKSAQNINVVWTTVVTNFANPDVAMMLTAVDWWHFTSSLSVRVLVYLRSSFLATLVS